MDSPLHVESLAFSYPRHPALSEVSFTVRAGSVHALLGPNGAGKSTTVACAVGLRRPTSGSVRIFGLDPLADHTRTAGLTGVMLQDGGLPMAARPMSVLTHLARMYAEPADVEELAARLGIPAFANRSIRRLSGGQKQRVGMAAALVGRPRLVFLDEPTAGLDPQARLVVNEVIRSLRDEGVAVVLTTHDMDDAAQLADDVTIIDHGTVIAQGTPAELVAAGGGDDLVRLTTDRPLEPGLRERLGRFGEVDAAGTTTRIRGTVGTADLHALLGVLHAEHVDIVDLSLHGRTLGDVFLDLTGRDLR